MVVVSPGINLAMIMCYYTHFLILNLHLNLFMSDVGCSLADPANQIMSLVSLCFSMAAIWFFMVQP